MFYKIIKGCKIKMDDSGNILIKRIAKTNVFVKSTEITTGQVSNTTQKKIRDTILNFTFDFQSAPTGENTSISSEILKLPQGGQLEPERPVKLFDMRKFQQVHYIKKLQIMFFIYGK